MRVLLCFTMLLFTISSAFATTPAAPEGEKYYYSSTEPSVFKIACELTSPNKMYCSVEQLFFVNDITNQCQISWSSNKDEFVYSADNESWVSMKKHDNECGVVNLSAFNQDKEGYWIYKFKTQVIFPESKSKGIDITCKKFENNEWTEYSTKVTSTNISCNQLILLPF